MLCALEKKKAVRDCVDLSFKVFDKNSKIPHERRSYQMPIRDVQE